MTTQIRPSVTNPPISSIYNEIGSGLLKLAPDFQRKFVWTQEHQEQFVDTILQGLPFPEIYVSTGEIDIENMRTVRNVIDGQQRLTTIKNFVDGNFERPPSLVKPYADLTRDQKTQFLSYEIVVRDLGMIDERTVREVFRRINLTKFKLDTIEIHNAIYDGRFIQTGKDILEKADLSVFGVFRESEFSRMGDLHFILQAMSTIELGGYFTQDNEVETLIEKYNEEYPREKEMASRLLRTLHRINSINLLSDSMWFRKSNFFTLICELTINEDRLRDDFKLQLLRIEENVMNNRGNIRNEFGVYYSYMYQNTNGRKARVIRSELFRKFCLKPN